MITRSGAAGVGPARAAPCCRVLRSEDTRRVQAQHELKTIAKTVSDVWAYFDSSALAKRYLDEAGRREVLRLLRRYDVVTSAVVAVELRSALRAVLRREPSTPSA